MGVLAGSWRHLGSTEAHLHLWENFLPNFVGIWKGRVDGVSLENALNLPWCPCQIFL